MLPGVAGYRLCRLTFELRRGRQTATRNGRYHWPVGAWPAVGPRLLSEGLGRSLCMPEGNLASTYAHFHFAAVNMLFIARLVRRLHVFLEILDVVVQIFGEHLLVLFDEVFDRLLAGLLHLFAVVETGSTYPTH